MDTSWRIEERRVARHREAGFTLVEALVALALVGVALLFDLGLQLQARAAREALEREADLLRRVEAVLESVRAGVHPLRRGAVDPALAWPSLPERDVVAVLEAEPSGLDGLCRVRVRATATGPRGRPHQVSLETLIWRREAPCP